MTTFDPDQSLPAPELTDLANGPDAFNALIAAMVDRLVKVYASAADRAVRNPAPSPGEMSVLQDVRRVELYSAAVSTWTPMPGQFIGETTITSADIVQAAGNNQVLISNTFTAISGVRYEAHFESAWLFSVGTAAIVSLLHAAAATVTTADTAVGARTIEVASTKSVPLSFTRTFVATATGTYTVGIGSNFFSGSGNLTWHADGSSGMYLRVRTV